MGTETDSFCVALMVAIWEECNVLTYWKACGAD